jgi:uncharacterized membrane protein YhaH (DUF805 family)
MLPRLWTDLNIPVRQRDYLVHGAALAVLKFAGDNLLVMLAMDRGWQPDLYFRTLGSLLQSELAGAPPWLFVALAAWTLPFLWLGVSLTLRRALNASLSPWWAVLFFVPWLNYGVMAMLLLAPSGKSVATMTPRAIEDVGTGRLLGAVGSGVLVGLIGVTAFTFWLRTYSAVLFLGLPSAMGMATAFVLNRNARVSNTSTFGAVLAVFVVAAGLALLLAIEGFVCLALAFPPVLLAGMLGAAVGVMIAEVGNRNLPPAFTALLALPLSAVIEPATGHDAVREVRSSVTIEATPAVVWQLVIAFTPISDPVPWWGRVGIAYPMSARIEGSGVGAVRYCEFSTGAFVEPITEWEPGRRLAFDVQSQPDPLRELSPWGNLAPPHLEGYLRSQRGEFRLVALPDGRTRLEGSTWYTIRMEPHNYWAMLFDGVIHRIHHRVLDHVAAESERAATPLAALRAVP